MEYKWGTSPNPNQARSMARSPYSSMPAVRAICSSKIYGYATSRRVDELHVYQAGKTRGRPPSRAKAQSFWPKISVWLTFLSQVARDPTELDRDGTAFACVGPGWRYESSHRRDPHNMARLRRRRG